MSSFLDAFNQFAENHHKKNYAIVWEQGDDLSGFKSGDWLGGMLEERLCREGPCQMKFLGQPAISRRTLIKTIESGGSVVIIDDASFTGSQIMGLIQSVQAINKDANISVITAFVTSEAIKKITSSAKLFYSKTMPTIRELIEKARLVDKESLRKEYIDMYGDYNLNKALTIFEHKIADHVSLPQEITRGKVYDEKGNWKNNVNFLEAPEVPYKRDIPAEILRDGSR